MANELFFDLETSIKNRGENAIGDMQASPFCPDNNIVYSGWKCGEGGLLVLTHDWVTPSPNWDLLVAHNISFDLLYLMVRDPGWYDYITTFPDIWDTQLAEYLLTGQTALWCSLDDLSKKYGGVLKDDRIKEYWKNGVDTENIPREEIIPYLENDVLNLKIIYKAQLEEATRCGMLPLIRSQMQARLATILMEYHGMEYDLERSRECSEHLQRVCDVYREALVDGMYELADKQVPRECLLPSSTQQISTLLFGGTFNYQAREPILDEEGNPVIYKSGVKRGMVKTKLQAKTFTTCDGSYLECPVPRGNNGFFPVGEEVLKKVEKKDTTGFVTALLKYRELIKQLVTYFEGYSALVWPHDNKIHGSLNHCQTATGRLSSSKPNLQNINNKDVGD